MVAQIREATQYTLQFLIIILFNVHNCSAIDSLAINECTGSRGLNSKYVAPIDTYCTVDPRFKRITQIEAKVRLTISQLSLN